MCLVTYSSLEEYSALQKLRKFESVKNLHRPLWGYVEITSKCNHHCPWCYGRFFQENTARHMTLDEYIIILDKMAKMEIMQITLTGGEPMDHPEVKKYIEIADDRGFLLHLNTNGDNLDEDMLYFLFDHNVKQLNFNFQGSKWHNKLHGYGYEELLITIDKAKKIGFEITTAAVIGEYNVDDIPQIFQEMAAAGADRLRVWDAVKSPKYSGSISISDLYARVNTAATALGYNHVVSYDPEVEGNIHVPCIAASNLIIYATANCEMTYCPGIQDPPKIGHWMTDSVEELINKALKYNEAIAELAPCKQCVARIDRSLLTNHV